MTITTKKLTQVRRLLARIADGHGDPRPLAQEAIVLIDQLVAAEGRRGRGEAEVQYLVEDSVNGPVLTEKRTTGRAFPFRCPKAVYDAMVQVLAGSDRSLPLDEIIGKVGDILGDQPAEYQVRVPLRLWMSVDPPLVVRMRARYRAASMNGFEIATSRVWTALQTS